MVTSFPLFTHNSVTYTITSFITFTSYSQMLTCEKEVLTSAQKLMIITYTYNVSQSEFSEMYHFSDGITEHSLEMVSWLTLKALEHFNVTDSIKND